MKEKKRKLFSVLDIVIIVVVIVVATLAFLSQFNRSADNLCCVIRQNGEVLHTIVLDGIKADTQYLVDGEYKVTVVVSENGAFVKNTSCPDKLCEHTGEITRSGQSIVCLPAKVSVTLENDTNEIDAVVG